MTSDHIQTLVDKTDMELYLMRLALMDGDVQSVENHANQIITLAGEIRRECFLQRM